MDVTYQPAIRRELQGNQLAIGNGGTFLTEAGSEEITSRSIGSLVALLGAGAMSVLERKGQLHRTIITLVAAVLTTVDDVTNGAQATQDLYLFPRGNILFLGGSSNLTITGDGTNQTTTAALVAAIGSSAAAADATLTSTEADFIPSTVATFTASVGTMKGKSTASKFFDNTTTTAAAQLKAKLNCAIPTAGSSAVGTLLVSGTVELVWVNLGDN